MSGPSQTGFLSFVRNVMGVSSTYVPDNSSSLTDAYNAALEMANEAIGAVAPTVYTLAVYNLAGDYLINWCPDQPNQTFMANLRTTFNCTQFAPGVVNYTGDEGSNTSLTVPKALETLTLGDLQNLKTPYGRQYLIFAQQYGTLWGLS